MRMPGERRGCGYRTSITHSRGGCVVFRMKTGKRRSGQGGASHIASQEGFWYIAEKESDAHEHVKSLESRNK